MLVFETRADIENWVMDRFPYSWVTPEMATEVARVLRAERLVEYGKPIDEEQQQVIGERAMMLLAELAG